MNWNGEIAILWECVFCVGYEFLSMGMCIVHVVEAYGRYLLSVNIPLYAFHFLKTNKFIFFNLQRMRSQNTQIQ